MLRIKIEKVKAKVEAKAKQKWTVRGRKGDSCPHVLSRIYGI
jgi:hypothetical protein